MRQIGPARLPGQQRVRADIRRRPWPLDNNGVAPSKGRPMRLFFAALAATLIYCSDARGHGDAEWIQCGGHRNAPGKLRFGAPDCFELEDDDVAVTEAGYFVKNLRETIPFNEALPSPDGKYWR